MEPADDEGKKVGPGSDNGVPHITDGGTVEGVDDRQEDGKNHPDEIHRERNRPPPGLLYSFEEGFPVAIVLREDDKGGE